MQAGFSIKTNELRDIILDSMRDGNPKSAKEILKITRLAKRKVWDSLPYWWKRGLLLRSEKPLFENQVVFKGRSGFKRNTRSYYLYILRTNCKDAEFIAGQKFVPFSEKYLDARSKRAESKAQLVLNYLKENSDKAFFSVNIAEALANSGVKIRDIMVNVRRYKKLVYVRGYRTDQRQTPFKEGYILTWINQDIPRKLAIEDAIRKTDAVLDKRSSTNPLIERIHSVRDMIIGAIMLNDIVSFAYLKNAIGCTEHELVRVVKRALQLYPDLREIKLFNVFRYYYHTEMHELDLKAAISMKENYIRIAGGRDNRIGHNWEAVPEWFVDKLTTARFWTQKHRTDKFDERRITIHLIKPVGGRRNNAEVDRVWEVTLGIFTKPITYILECKWGLVQKKYLDDFFEVIRWSKEFGVDSSDGRKIKQGVVGVFAGSAFNPRERIRLKNDTVISLSAYAARMNIQLLKAANFNEMLRERGIPKEITVQRICRIARNESEVREILEAVWEDPKKSNDVLTSAIVNNKEVYEFEKMLESKDSPQRTL
jgi:hypothetical protein